MESTDSVEVNQIKIKEEKEESPSFRCNLFDSEVVHKISQILLLGLSTACVDNTTGDLFKGPAIVAVDMKKEMVDYFTQRSETYVAESVVQEGGADAENYDHPTDVISDFVDDFTSLKRNLFGRVSGWLLSERREDRIDDFVQEMEISGFWSNDRREAIAQTLLKNVDFKNMYTCDMKYGTMEELNAHSEECKFRIMSCPNEGCAISFCAVHKDKHDEICSFRYLPCEQGCSETIMRHEMDRHCITVCPMKLVNCKFYSVGCQATIPVCKIDVHIAEAFQSHVQHILKIIHKEASVEDLKYRFEQLEKSSSLSDLSQFRDVRSLTNAVKKLDAKLGPLEHVPVKEENLEPEVVSAPSPGDSEKQTAKNLEPEIVSAQPSNDSEKQIPEKNLAPEVESEKISETLEKQIALKDPETAEMQKEVTVESKNQVCEKNPEPAIVSHQDNKIHEVNAEAKIMPEQSSEKPENQYHEQHQEREIVEPANISMKSENNVHQEILETEAIPKAVLESDNRRREKAHEAEVVPEEVLEELEKQDAEEVNTKPEEVLEESDTQVHNSHTTTPSEKVSKELNSQSESSDEENTVAATIPQSEKVSEELSSHSESSDEENTVAATIPEQEPDESGKHVKTSHPDL
ncbi:hypothetical protein MKW98_031118 [Papaver atlanticum]|uniref:TRAF-type domain-containing protein n=1 Tax=Papaver atlanticum TaxID=357466 RepID=A0AAD4SWR8_9MAGN|nr:hypothetical protein MKW98_031118 [Papaver atlanticum]